jgi:hypothetical protein
MTYNANIPQPTDNLSVSQGQFLTNFGQLDEIFDNDHYTFDDATSGGAYRGFHRQITLAQTNAPASVPTDPSSIIFTKNNSAGHPYPFFLNSQAANVAAALPFLPDLLGNTVQAGFKIGQVIVNTGQGTLTGANPATGVVTFKIPFPTQMLFVGFTLNGGATVTTYLVSTQTSGSTIVGVTAGFRANGNQDFYYLAIGN